MESHPESVKFQFRALENIQLSRCDPAAVDKRYFGRGCAWCEPPSTRYREQGLQMRIQRICSFSAACASMWFPECFAGDRTDDFDFQVRPLSKTFISDYPMGLDLTITYKGEEPLATMSWKRGFLRSSLAIQLPAPWQPRKWDGTNRPVDGVIEYAWLRRGDIVTRRVYLHSYFSEMGIGKARGRVMLRIVGKKNSWSANLEAGVAFEVEKSEPERFRRWVESLQRRIAGESKASKQREMYESVADLTNIAILPVLLDSLSARPFYDASYQIVFLCEKHGDWEQLVDYLALHGVRIDHLFFQAMKGSELQVTERQRKKLLSSASPWVRVYAVEAFSLGSGKRLDGVLGSLESEIKDLGAYLERVKKAARNAQGK